MHPKHPIVEAHERLREVMVPAGHRVQLHVERANGSELGAYHQDCIPASVPGHRGDERRPGVTDDVIDTLALLDELIAQELDAAHEPPPDKPADPLPRAS